MLKAIPEVRAKGMGQVRHLPGDTSKRASLRHVSNVANDRGVAVPDISNMVQHPGAMASDCFEGFAYEIETSMGKSVLQNPTEGFWYTGELWNREERKEEEGIIGCFHVNV